MKIIDWLDENFRKQVHEDVSPLYCRDCDWLDENFRKQVREDVSPLYCRNCTELAYC